MNYSIKEYKSVVTRIGVALLLFLLLFNVLYGGVTSAAELLVSAFNGSRTVIIISELLCAVSYLLSFALPVPFFYAISKDAKCHPMELSLKIPSARPWITYTAIIFAGLAIIIPMATINSLIFPVYEESYAAMEDTIFKTSDSYRIMLDFLATAIVPAFAEEFLFRGLIVSNLKPYSKSAAVIVSAVTFGLMHQNPTQLFYATAAGLGLGLVYVTTESIWCCIALHFVNNLISILQTYSVSLFGYDTALLLVTFFDIFVIIIGIICGIYLLLGLKKEKEKQRQNTSSVFGVYDSDGRLYEAKRKNNLALKAFATPSVAVFMAVCIVICAYVSLALNAF